MKKYFRIGIFVLFCAGLVGIFCFGIMKDQPKHLQLKPGQSQSIRVENNTNLTLSKITGGKILLSGQDRWKLLTNKTTGAYKIYQMGNDTTISYQRGPVSNTDLIKKEPEITGDGLLVGPSDDIIFQMESPDNNTVILKNMSDKQVSLYVKSE